mmetsp:Transcript_83252/g.263011  ORF Transcript_83252/g.263011 Transcript_83252/m.263011 type:complete len:270 (-) Transcript_83252:1034-1843(-)
MASCSTRSARSPAPRWATGSSCCSRSASARVPAHGPTAPLAAGLTWHRGMSSSPQAASWATARRRRRASSQGGRLPNSSGAPPGRPGRSPASGCSWACRCSSSSMRWPWSPPTSSPSGLWSATGPPTSSPCPSLENTSTAPRWSRSPCSRSGASLAVCGQASRRKRAVGRACATGSCAPSSSATTSRSPWRVSSTRRSFASSLSSSGPRSAGGRAWTWSPARPRTSCPSATTCCLDRRSVSSARTRTSERPCRSAVVPTSWTTVCFAPA